ncbi:outer membrane protein assembly factor BamD [Mangrovimonas spongiae]|uniref:Outer membrane protein assembly factor BamD n=1 Tax=Mangrovimonas spongiae TaxID=2494697 RepID=A0A3R9NV51_9FLAO|nr:outer membrane protein assembly factor BamD [Mangrovimonas spongiae]RSK38289.1 outer membrane protein assembly factor BamD [Mangrovimonas spongiae]
MKKLFYIFITFTILTSCSEYQKALKSEEVSEKFKVGEALYDKGKYAKANKLFEQIIPSYRGKPQAEKLTYLNAMAYFKMDEYYLAGYHFDRFVSAYPESEKVEEAAFLSAKSTYMLSPVFSKAQIDTKDAIDKFQQFINLYPESEYLPEANKLVKELDYKLELKAFEIAKQYNKIAGYTGDYEAPIKAFDNFIFDFPGSSLREDALYYKLDSAYNLAMNSIESKKQERLENAKTYYSSFKKSYSESEYIEEADKMIVDINNELKKYNTKS